MKNVYNWGEIKKQIMGLAASEPWTHKSLSKVLKIPVSTLHDNIDLAQINGATTFTRRQSNDEMELVSEGYFPKTPEALAEQAGINLAEFNVKSFDCFAREVYVKDLEKDLYFDEGKITGEIHDTGKMRVRTIWSSRMLVEPVKIKLRGITLVPVHVDLPKQPERPPELPSTGMKTLVLPDIHFPYQEQALLEEVLRLIVKVEPEQIIILGDILDLAEFSNKFVLSPEQVRSTQDAINQTGQFLALVRRRAPKATIKLLEGNHDLRLTLQLRKHLMALAGLKPAGEIGREISVAYFLNLDQLQIEFVPGWPDSYADVSGTLVIHGNSIGSNPGQTGAKLLNKYNQSVVFGHTHRREYVETAIWSDLLKTYKTIFAYSPGCLCKVDGSVPGSSPASGWRQGIGLLTTKPNGQSFIRDYQFDPESRRLLE